MASKLLLFWKESTPIFWSPPPPARHGLVPAWFHCASLYFKERWERFALVSRHSLQKSNSVEIAPVALNKRATMSESLPKTDGSDSLFSKSELLFHSFAHKKEAICLKNQKANSQPWQEDCTLSFWASTKTTGSKERYNYRPASKLMSTWERYTTTGQYQNYGVQKKSATNAGQD